jgi:L-ascorbate 6-phosphate lactonase
MKTILDAPLSPDQAAVWHLGQASCIVLAAGVTVAVDPYLTDSAGLGDARFARLLPVPIEPEDLEVDVLIVTHNHLDHLDPDTLRGYRHAETTWFVAPRLAARALEDLGIPYQRIHVVDVGDEMEVGGVRITGVYAVPTGLEVLDTTGYKLTFGNDRSIYLASDTAYSRLLLEAAPWAEVLVVPINGKWGNLGPEQAAELTAAVRPRYVVPNHYDLFAPNTENPEAFRLFLDTHEHDAECVVLPVMGSLTWGPAERLRPGRRRGAGGS